MSKESLSNITEVAPGVYFRFGDIGRGQSNGGYIICDDYVVAVEAPSVESTAVILHLVGTNRLFFLMPNAPTLNAR